MTTPGADAARTPAGRAVHVVVVAYHAADLLEQALEPLAGRVPLTVVDNSSSAAVRQVCERLGVSYVDSGANRGFAGGVNIGLRRLPADPPQHVLLLNPDARLEPADLHRLVSALEDERYRGTAALSPRVVDLAGREQRVAWPFPRPARQWLEAVGLSRLNRADDFLIGAALLLRAEAVAQVGLFDERFFLYAEEADWQRRAARLGWRVAVVPEATLVHVGAGTSSNPARREELFLAGTETYVRKWFGSRGWQSHRLAQVCGSGVRAVLLRGRRGALARLHLRILLAGPRRKAGLT